MLINTEDVKQEILDKLKVEYPDVPNIAEIIENAFSTTRDMEVTIDILGNIIKDTLVKPE